MRFAHGGMPEEFFEECFQVAHDESRHFGWLSGRLESLGSYYGELPAHGALWDLGIRTKNDFDGRLACIPLVQEAKGLDAGPRLVARLKALGDEESAGIVQDIVKEEENHVAFGLRWFHKSSERQGKDTVKHFHERVREYFPRGLPGTYIPTSEFTLLHIVVNLKTDMLRLLAHKHEAGPFNESARTLSGMSKSWYMPVSRSGER